MKRSISWLVLACLTLIPSVLSAQGLLLDSNTGPESRLPRPYHWPPIPRPPVSSPVQSYKIRELTINANVTDQVAKVQISQSFVNTSSRAMEVSFVFPLPYDGAVERMTFLVDGREYEAKLMTSGEARKIYEDHIRRNQDPALLEWIGSGMFKTSVFPVPPGAERTVTLRFSQLCRKNQGLTELLLPLATAKYTAQPIEKLTLDVSVQSQASIKNVYSPTHSVNVSRSSDKGARVTFTASQHVPSDDFRLMYDVGDALVGASVLSYRRDANDEGFFLLLVSPDIKRTEETRPAKTVVFVVDRSGSMSGKKIEQAKSALKFVLNNLRQGDLFNIVAYDSVVESFRPELQRYSDETRAQALGFVDGIYAGGSTNIDGALRAALGQLQDDSRPNYVIFLTDGLPTAGETNESKIVENLRASNKVRARVFSMGVGYDVNSRLIDKISRRGFGKSEFVRPNEDIEVAVSQLYNRIGAPALTNLAIRVDMEGFPPDRGSVASRLYPKDSYDLFAGEQMAIVGRYKQGGAAKVVISGTVDGRAQSFDFPAQLAERSADDTFGFVEKLWAMRRIGEIIDLIDLEGKNKELVDELVALSTRHGILTPYTSFLADETVHFRELAGNRKRAEADLSRLERLESGAEAFEQRRSKRNLQYDSTAPAAGFAQSAPAAPAGAKAAGRSLGVAGGGGVGGAGAGAMAGEGRVDRVATVQNVGSKTFYLRENRWCDSTLTEEQERNVVKLKRYSPEFFELVAKHGKEVARYLAIEGNITLVLEGQAYLFE